MSFDNFAAGHGHSFGGEYVELMPLEKIRYTDRFDDPDRSGEMQTTVTLKPDSCGTELHVVQEGVPEVIPVGMCYLGWQESFLQLANLVKPEIPDRRRDFRPVRSSVLSVYSNPATEGPGSPGYS